MPPGPTRSNGFRKLNLVRRRAGGLHGTVAASRPSNLMALGSGRGMGAGRGKGGRGGHSTAGRSTPWGSSPAPVGKGAWGTGSTPGEAVGGNRKASAYDPQPHEVQSLKMNGTASAPTSNSAWSCPPPGSSSQSAAARKGSAPWTKRQAAPIATGWQSPCDGGPASPHVPIEDAFGALSGAPDHYPRLPYPQKYD